ncbi:hypothetical protein Nit79A3_1480 [Nitrosomonas sp. Is79A3]|uniref:hypothetical protein n=1 Tax=Nitrosomonas sp. (strain Is79A3) TaxID=261292 RepID=UPI000215D1AF
MKKCKSCKFFLGIDDEQGFCRRFPPTPIPGKDDAIYSHFPMMLNDGWCGEFKLKAGSK